MHNFCAQSVHQIAGNIGKAVTANQVTNAAHHADNHQKQRYYQPLIAYQCIPQQGIGYRGGHARTRQLVFNTTAGHSTHSVSNVTKQIDKGDLGKRMHHQTKDTDHKCQPVATDIADKPCVSFGAIWGGLLGHIIFALGVAG